DVGTITLDGFWKKVLRKKRVDILKIDIEGNEFKALHGSFEMLTRQPPYIIFISISDIKLNRSGHNASQLVDTLTQQFNYEALEIMTLQPYKNFVSKKMVYVAFVHKDVRKEFEEVHMTR
ncbi:hypothetical protein HDU76_003254, partial [Blyttiomyces sp. JEL0837]